MQLIVCAFTGPAVAIPSVKVDEFTPSCDMLQENALEFKREIGTVGTSISSVYGLDSR